MYWYIDVFYKPSDFVYSFEKSFVALSTFFLSNIFIAQNTSQKIVFCNLCEIKMYVNILSCKKLMYFIPLIIMLTSVQNGILSKSTRVQNPPDQNQPESKSTRSKSTRSKSTRVKIHPIKIHPVQNPPDQNQPDSKSNRVEENTLLYLFLFKSNII